MISQKQIELISLYQQMAEQGVNRGPAKQSDSPIPSDYSLMNIRMFKGMVKPLFQEFAIRTVLDYGSGNTSWDSPDFDGTESAKQFFGLDHVVQYEPSMGLNDLTPCDAVVSFDVLEHIFLADISSAVWDLFAHAKKLVVVNIACYKARAILPNGENAHITVRPPTWWKGVFDTIASAFPEVTYKVYASTSFGKAQEFPATSMAKVLTDPGFTRPIP